MDGKNRFVPIDGLTDDNGFLFHKIYCCSLKSLSVILSYAFGNMLI